MNRFLQLGLAFWVSVLLSTTATAQSGEAIARYTTPAGWQANTADGAVSFSTDKEPADTVQLMLLPSKAQQGDFQTQFTAERQSLEAQWALSAPQAAAPQSAKVGSASYAAYYASYDSAAGPRYMAFMATGQRAKLTMLVFVAASAEAFNRQSAQAAALLQSLQIAP